VVFNRIEEMKMTKNHHSERTIMVNNEKSSNENSDETLKRTILIVISIASFLFPFMASGVNIAIPSIARDFNMNAVSLNWVATSFLLAAAMLSVPFGRLADIYGRKKLFIAGFSIYSLGSLLSGLAPNQEMLIAFRIIQGIGGSMYSGSGMAIVTSVFPPGERGKAFGITTASIYLGLSCGPFFGGILTQHLGWRALFLLNVPLYPVILWMLIRKLKKDWMEAEGERFDYLGSVLFGLTIIGVIYGFSTFPKTYGIIIFGVGILSLAAFIIWEKKTESPVLNISLFSQSKVFVFSNAAALINYSATFAVTILLSLYLQYAKGMNPQSAGVILVTQPVIQAIFSPFTGRLSDRIEPRIVASVGFCITTIGLFMLSFLSAGTGLNYIVICLFILGFGFALFSSPNTNAVMSSVPGKYLGVASSFLGTMRITGQTMSMGISTLIFSIYLGNVKITPERNPVFIRSLHTLFIIFGCLSVAGIFASFARGKSLTNDINNSK
jgi:EmrB/QacA subfamily drug resistance transporter